MSNSQNLRIDQKLQTRLSLQHLRFAKILELNTPELEEAVDRELESNPALEKIEDSQPPVETSAYSGFSRSYRNNEDEHDFTPPDNEETLYDALLSQLGERNLPEKTDQTARYIVASLDSNGYLRRPVENIVDDMAFGPGIDTTVEEVIKALDVVRSLDPAGVGATDLRDCLILQLERMPETPDGESTREDALLILRDQFEAFTMKHTHKLISRLHMDASRVKEALSLILTLNPKPGSAFDSASDRGNVVIPDLTVSNEEGVFTISVNSRIPEMAVSKTFEEGMREIEGRDKGKKRGSEFIVQRFNDAREFIRILNQRQDTLISVMSAIIKIQKEYFETEDVYSLKPMMIKDVAAVTGFDFSVISRATTNKFVALPWGVFPLRFFFSDSIGGETGGEDAGQTADILTNRKMEAEIADIVEHEDKRHPISDEGIKDIMLQRGYEVSRRTVAKYRDRKGIPVARLRKDL